MFRAVLLEAFDCSFRVLIDDLKDTIFTDNGGSSSSVASNSTSGGAVVPASPVSSRKLKSPPLASLLPQLKSSALRFLPMNGVGEVVGEIVSGPNVAALCSAIIDATSKSSRDLMLSRHV